MTSFKDFKALGLAEVFLDTWPMRAQCGFRHLKHMEVRCLSLKQHKRRSFLVVEAAAARRSITKWKHTNSYHDSNWTEPRWRCTGRTLEQRALNAPRGPLMMSQRARKPANVSSWWFQSDAAASSLISVLLIKQCGQNPSLITFFHRLPISVVKNGPTPRPGGRKPWFMVPSGGHSHCFSN